MRNMTWRQRCVVVMMVLSSGTVLQTSCNETAAEVSSGLFSSISTQYIRSLVNNWLKVSPSFNF